MMKATQCELALDGGKVKVLRNDSECTVYWIPNDDGDVVMASYHVFPGIDLIYNDVHTRRCSVNTPSSSKLFEINHCKEGRIECEAVSKFFYLTQGDMAIGKKRDSGHTSYFPGGHYHGITISIDIDCAPDCLSCFLDDVDIKPTTLVSMYSSEDGGLFIMREKPALERIFSELYSVPDAIRKGFLRSRYWRYFCF